MDMLTVDLTPVPEAHVGSAVELWGARVPVDDVARAAGTVGYELLCALAPRVPKIDGRLMAKARTQYVCTECGGQTRSGWASARTARHGTRWSKASSSRRAAGAHRFASLAADAAGRARWPTSRPPRSPRSPTGIEELDRVLGGGIVAGGVVLIGGDPGIGKSTLLLQALDALSRAMKVLYVTGEESRRAGRAALAPARPRPARSVRVLAEIHLEKILATIEAEQPGGRA